MRIKSLVAGPLMGVVVTAFVAVSAYATLPVTNAIAETHANCATFDNSGNITSVTPNCSETNHFTSPPMTFTALDPCTSTLVTVTINDDHSVFHITVNGAGDVWITGTDGGTVTVSGPPDGSGTWITWFGSSLNNKSAVFHSTFNQHIRLSDGTSADFHDTAHTTFTPNGPGVSFDKPDMAFNCG
ncbi:MAG TPA: hypothetical protein VFZ97_11300 [Acidimicrobiales bacterium]